MNTQQEWTGDLPIRDGNYWICAPCTDGRPMICYVRTNTLTGDKWVRIPEIMDRKEVDLRLQAQWKGPIEP